MELCYQIYNPGSITKNKIMASFPEIHLKTLGIFSANQSIPTSSSGQLTLNYTAKYGSVKGVALLPSASTATANAVNGSYDNYDLTISAGSYQIFIGSDPYPKKPLSTTLSKNGLLLKWRKFATCLGTYY